MIKSLQQTATDVDEICVVKSPLDGFVRNNRNYEP